jgi:hypothetical protein
MPTRTQISRAGARSGEEEPRVPFGDVCPEAWRLPAHIPFGPSISPPLYLHYCYPTPRSYASSLAYSTHRADRVTISGHARCGLQLDLVRPPKDC